MGQITKYIPPHTTNYLHLLIISLETVCTGITPLHAHPQVFYCNCVKILKYWLFYSSSFTRNMDRRTDRQGDSLIPPTKYKLCKWGNNKWFNGNATAAILSDLPLNQENRQRLVSGLWDKTDQFSGHQVAM